MGKIAVSFISLITHTPTHPLPTTGCSSILALFVENGPCSVNEFANGTVPNPYSWNSNANILWLDQPVGKSIGGAESTPPTSTHLLHPPTHPPTLPFPGVGFSYGEKDDYIDDEDGVGEDFYQFLQAFLKANAQYQALPFFVFGESYGGA